jgi:hypothetical protein
MVTAVRVKQDGFFLVVPKAALPSLLNALARRADGASAFWFPIEEELAARADRTRRATGRLEGLVEDTTVHVKRGVFYGIVTLTAAAPEHDELFAESALIHHEMRMIVREAGGGIAVLSRVPNREYERLDRPDSRLTLDPSSLSIDELAEAVGIKELPPPSRRR